MQRIGLHSCIWRSWMSFPM